MSSTNPGSRWANEEDDKEAIAAAALRKKEKEEKKRAKEARVSRATAAAVQNNSDAQQQAHHNSDNIPVSNDEGQPNKRIKTDLAEHEQPQQKATSGTGATTSNQRQDDVEEGANLLAFPSTGFGPSGDVSDYELLNRIEEGSYGMVSRARLKSSGQVVALKRLKMENNHDGFPVTGLREIQTLMACHHSNIVTLQEVVVGSSLNDVYLVMDFLEHDLKTLLEDMSEPFLPSETKTLMIQIVSAIDYLHTNWIMHRDLKTSNLLLNNRGEIKLADFGMARYTGNPPPKLTQLVVTLWYRAPELLLGIEDYDFSIDVWSVGCIFAELLTREPLLQGKNEVDQLSKIFKLLGTPTKATWPGFQSLPNAKALYPILSNSTQSRPMLTSSTFPYLTGAGHRLLSSLLSMDPAARPSAAEILQHPYFREDPKPKAKELFPTFPSKAGQEKRRRRATPQAPVRGDAPKLAEKDFAGMFAGGDDEMSGAGFALRMG